MFNSDLKKKQKKPVQNRTAKSLSALCRRFDKLHLSNRPFNDGPQHRTRGLNCWIPRLRLGCRITSSVFIYVPATPIPHCSKLLQPRKIEMLLALPWNHKKKQFHQSMCFTEKRRNNQMLPRLTFAAHVNLFLIKIYTQDDLNHLPLHKQIICTQVIVQQKRK